jgi:photosystem II stability/assembly factor-like uncharacterized protein
MPQGAISIAAVALLSVWIHPIVRAQEPPATGENEWLARRLGISVEDIEDLRTQRGMTTEALAEFPKERVPRLLRRVRYADLQRRRQEFRLLQDRDERGLPASVALGRAFEQLRTLRRSLAPSFRAAGLPMGSRLEAARLPFTAGLGPGAWRSLGPGNIGGRIRSILVHPTDANRLWVGSVGGGLWRTTDGGLTWAAVDDFMANLAVSCAVMSPTNPDVMFAGTGEGFGNIDALQGAGIFRTTDGTNWSRLPSTAPDATQNFLNVNRLALSSDGNVLLVATPKGIFRSVNAGDSWTQESFDDVADLDFHPSDPNLAIAGSRDGGAAYYSTDGGLTWKTATHSGAWSGRVEVTYSRNDASIIYASVDSNGGEIWRSRNGGKRFYRRSTGTGYLAGQGWYDNAIWAGDPTDAELVIVGGVDLFRSTDAGRTLTPITQWWDPRSAHADHHVIVSHPRYDGTSNLTAFFGNDGGIYRADNVRSVSPVAGWAALNNTLAITQFYGVAGSSTSGTLIGGAQDNGTLRFRPADGAQQWHEMEGGDGGFCAADPTDPDVFYGEYVYIGIHRSTDGGGSAEYINGSFWNGANWDWKPEPFRIPDSASEEANFIAPFVIDPSEPNRILTGGLSLWRTNDAKAANTNTTGPRWERVKPPIGIATFEHSISAIAVASSDSARVWVGHNNGSVYRSANATAPSPAWTRVDRSGGNPLPRRYCHRIAIDPTNPARVYVAFGGYSSGNVWKTTNDGASWTNLSGSLPQAPVRAIAIHPARPSFVYIGTDVGVFASENGGASWSPTNEGPTNCSVHELVFIGNTLVAATHGRGVFKIDIP